MNVCAGGGDFLPFCLFFVTGLSVFFLYPRLSTAHVERRGLGGTSRKVKKERPKFSKSNVRKKCSSGVPCFNCVLEVLVSFKVQEGT